MSTVATLRDKFDKTDWKVAFAGALLRLRPSMNPDAADEISDAQYLISHGREPDDAADDWILRNRGYCAVLVGSEGALARPATR
jgi:hypothetical protein